MKRECARAGEVVRGAGRLCALGAVIGWAAVTWLARPGERRNTAARARWLGRTSRRVLRVLAVRVVERGRAPEGGALVVANHVGYLDILVIAASTPVVFVAKVEVRGWPLFGWLAAAAGTRFIDRGTRGDVARVGVEMAAVLNQDVAVVLFPEGTSTNGTQVRPFKSSLLQPAVEAGRSVVPVALGYAVPAGRSVDEEVAWWGDRTLGPHLMNLTTLHWIEARIVWGEDEAGASDRKALALSLWRSVVAMKAAGAGIDEI